MKPPMHVLSSLIHHPTAVENSKKCETKLPFPHTRQERIEELKALVIQFEKDGGPALYAKGMLALAEYKTDEEYKGFITEMHELDLKIAKLKETK